MSGEDQNNQRRGGLFSKLRMPFGRAAANGSYDAAEEPAAVAPVAAPEPPAAAPIEAPVGTPSEEFARIESILRELDTAPAKPENAVRLSFATVLRLVPERYRKTSAAEAEAGGTVSVAIENLFDQLASGRVAIPLALLVLDLPPELVSSEANKDFTTIVSLPLDEVVAAVDPETLSRGMAALSLSPLVDRLPDPFSTGETEDITLTAPPPRVAPAPAAPTASVPSLPPQPPRRPTAPPEPPRPSPEEVARAARAIPAWAAPESAKPAAKPAAPSKPAEPAVPIIVPVVQPKERTPPPKPITAPSGPPTPAPAPAAPVTPPPQPPRAAAPSPAAPAAPAAKSEPEPDLSAEYGERLHGIDVNAATLEQLATLPGATPAVARSILEFREAHGPFRSVFDLSRVPHVGRVTFRKLTGMPYNTRHRHRIHKLANLLDIPVRRAHRLQLIAERLCSRPGFDGCVISDAEGLVMALHAADDYGATLGALAPRLLKRMEESVRELDQGAVNSMSLSIGERMFTVVRSGNIFVCTRHRRRRLTMNDLVLTERVAAELAWLLSHRACVGASDARPAGSADG